MLTELLMAKHCQMKMTEYFMKYHLHEKTRSLSQAT